MTVTELQKPAYNAMLELKQDQRMLIEGEGGAGKTYTMMSAILELINRAGQDSQLRIALVAPTHSAKNTLYTKFCELLSFDDADTLEILSCINCFTSAGFCGRYLIENIESGDLYDGLTETSKAMQSWDLVILDEVSLTPIKDLMHMLACSKKWPLICSGDRDQCPAVKQPLSPVFDPQFCKDKKIAYYYIKGNMRNDSEIRAITKNCKGNVPYYPAEDSEENTVFGNSDALAEHFIDTVTEAFEMGEENWGINYAFIAYTNKRVNSIAEELRARMFGNTDNLWHAGEYIRINATVMKIVLAQELKQISIEDCKYNFAMQNLILRDITTGEEQIYSVLCPDQLAVYESAKAYYQSAGDAAKKNNNQLAKYFWGIRSAITRNITTASLACCITAIKAQSRTIANVWVDTPDIKRWAANKGRILFTAYGRCSDHLYTVHIPKPIVTPYQKFCTACRQAGVRRMAASRYQAYSIGKLPEKLSGLSMQEIEERHIAYWLTNG